MPGRSKTLRMPKILFGCPNKHLFRTPAVSADARTIKPLRMPESSNHLCFGRPQYQRMPGQLNRSGCPKAVTIYASDARRISGCPDNYTAPDAQEILGSKRCNMYCVMNQSRQKDDITKKKRKLENINTNVTNNGCTNSNQKEHPI